MSHPIINIIYMISVQQYRCSIGSWNLRQSYDHDVVFLLNHKYISKMQYMYLFCTCVTLIEQCQSKFKLSAVLLLLLVISGNIHPHPGPIFDNLSICHINCRSLLAFDKETKSNTMKLEEIESVLCTTGKFDIICMSET